MNELVISGKLTQPEFAHQINDENIYSALISTKRTSGTVDTIKVLLPERLLIKEQNVLIIGEFRSHNTPDKHLELYAYVTDVYPCEDNTQDKVTLTGYVCKSPIVRKTPKGRIITDLLIAVPRKNIMDRSDYIPVVSWKDNSELKIGDKITVTGRVQSREHRKGVAYEVSAAEVKKEEV